MRSSRKNESSPLRRSDHRLAHEAEASASGALVGAVVGAGGGPAGIVAGVVLGGLAGVATGAALDSESSRRAAHDRELDDAIGVTRGDLGAPGLAHPAATVGAYSAASSGASPAGDGSPAEGPMQPVEK